MASCAPASDGAPGGWTRWVWVPLLLSGLGLGAVGWRAIVQERALLHEQLRGGQENIARQVSGGLVHQGRQVVEKLRGELSMWAVRQAFTDPTVEPELPRGGVFDLVDGMVLHIDGHRVFPRRSPARGPARRWFCAVEPFIEAGRHEEALLETEVRLQELLHAPSIADPTSTLNELDSTIQLLQPLLRRQAHWAPPMADLSERARRRLRADAASLRLEGRFRDLAHRANASGLAVDQDGEIFVVVTWPELPRGEVLVAHLDGERLVSTLIHLLGGPLASSADGPSDLAVGIRLRNGGIQPLLGTPPASPPSLVHAVIGGFPPWDVVVWDTGGRLQGRARAKVLVLAFVLVAALGMLVLGGVLTSRALESHRQSLAMKSDFLANVTHELKTPLTSIALYAELLDSGKAPGREQEFGSTIRREAARLGTLIEGLLATARLEAGPGALERVPVDLAELTAEVAMSLEPMTRTRGIRLNLNLEPGLRVLGDPSGLRSIVQNLLDNAIKYGRAEGDVSATLRAADGGLRFEVRDDGPGIPRGERKRVFERFYRGGEHLTRSTPGTGLGLSIVRRAVELHGGKIHLSSEEGTGTVVTVVLPCHEEPT